MEKIAEAEADAFKEYGVNWVDRFRRCRINVGGEQPGCICVEDERQSGGADLTEMLSNCRRGNDGDEGLNG